VSEQELRDLLRGLPLGGLRYFSQIGSTNDEALAWAAAGASDFSLVAADEQSAGRGRAKRKWFTPPGAALAFSLVLRPNASESEFIGRFSGLAALALVNALQKYGVSAQIKWPNDVLIQRKKVAGILVESAWQGAKIESVIVGMGVNATPEAIPPASGLTFPATCLAAAGLNLPSRFDLLKNVLKELISLRAALASDAFLRQWQASLAFGGETVQLLSGDAPALTGQIEGLEPDGSLRMRLFPSGAVQTVHFGEIHLRPL